MRARLIALALLTTACAHAPGGEPGAATVVDVRDGDTIQVRLGGRTEEVRLIGIDTPETHHPSRPVECFGVEATARTEELLPEGTAIRLERDQEPRDRYDRLLAYVYVADSGTFVNLELVQGGYADAYPFPPNEAHARELEAAASRARSAHTGLWGACGGPDTPAQ